MRSTKKFLCLLLSVAMLVSCFAFSVSAVPADGKEVAYKLVADKTSYNPGDVVTFSLYVDVADPAQPYGASAFYFSYDNTVFSPTVSNRTFYNEFASVYKPGGAVTSSATVHKAIKTALDATGESAIYNASFVVAGIWDATCGIPSADGIPLTPGALQMTFQMQVLDTVAPGTTSSVAITQGAINTPTRMYLKHANGSKVASADYDLTNATAQINIAAAGPAVAKSKAEVKMTPNSATTVEDAFSFRVTSVITDADWDAYFANSADSGATNNAIKRVGFVAYKGTAGFNLDTAKAVAQGSSAVGYDVATTDYIQKANDTSDAFFGCRLDITSAATRSDVTYVAFVQYLDATGNTAYAFYDAEQQALLNTNYNNIVSTYLAAHPYAG